MAVPRQAEESNDRQDKAGHVGLTSSRLFSSELIQRTIEVWQPYSKEELTRDDAIEILYNTAELARLLAELCQDERSKEG